MFLYIRTKSPVPGNWLLLLWDKLIVSSSCWTIFVKNERKPSIFIYSLSHRTRDTHTHTLRKLQLQATLSWDPTPPRERLELAPVPTCFAPGNRQTPPVASSHDQVVGGTQGDDNNPI